MRPAVFSLLLLGPLGCVKRSAPAPSEIVTPTDTGDSEVTPLENRLVNGGFEQGESWWRPSGYANHNWAKTGDGIYQSSASFQAFEGERAQKVWGFYSGSVPNDSEHGLSLSELSAGDQHVFSAQIFTPTDDGIGGGSQATLFLRYRDAGGVVLAEETSAPLNQDSERDTWSELRIETLVPEGAVSGELGLRFTLADWSAGGAVYLDDARWTSTGTGVVVGERLLVWKDEFEGNALDSESWTPLELPAYTYNNEMQRYTNSPSNASVSNGVLTITARQEADGSVTSARLVSDTKAEWRYGRIEAMAMVPSGVGTWPAFWMLPSDWAYGGWPDSGEIDILEHVGCTQGTVYQTVHTGAYNHLLGTQQGGETRRDASAGMHLYAVDWSPEVMVFTVDGEQVFVFENDGRGDSATWPFDKDFHIILNLAFGGDWGGYCGVDLSSLPEEFVVDWVRVFE